MHFLFEEFLKKYFELFNENNRQIFYEQLLEWIGGTPVLYLLAYTWEALFVHA